MPDGDILRPRPGEQTRRSQVKHLNTVIDWWPYYVGFYMVLIVGLAAFLSWSKHKDERGKK